MQRDDRAVAGAGQRRVRPGGPGAGRLRRSYQVAGRQWRVQKTFRVRAEFADDRRAGGGPPGPGPGDRRRGGRARSCRRRAGPAGRRWCSGSTSGSGRWSAPTPWPGSSPRGWSAPRSSRSSPAGPTPRRWPSCGPIASERPIELADLLKRGLRPRSSGSTPWPRPPSRAWARSTPIAALDPQGARGASASSSSDDEAYRKLVALSRPRRADARRPGGEPRRPEADLAALALLQRPRLLRPRPRPLPPRRRARQPDPPRGRPVRARPVGPDAPAAGSRLDEVAAWFKKVQPARHPRSSSPPSPTTTATPTSPRSSPRSRPTPSASTSSRSHAIDSAGWFSSRKVAAVGFGSHAPRTLDRGRRGQPVAPRRDHPVHPAGVIDRKRPDQKAGEWSPEIARTGRLTTNNTNSHE